MVNNVPNPVDRVGREIQIGDVVAYATGSSSSVSLNLGRVVELPISTRSFWSRDPFGKHVSHDEKFRKLKLQPVNVDGTPIMQMEWDNVQRVSVPTGRPVRCVTTEKNLRAVVIENL